MKRSQPFLLGFCVLHSIRANSITSHLPLQIELKSPYFNVLSPNYGWNLPLSGIFARKLYKVEIWGLKKRGNSRFFKEEKGSYLEKDQKGKVKATSPSSNVI